MSSRNNYANKDGKSSEEKVEEILEELDRLLDKICNFSDDSDSGNHASSKSKSANHSRKNPG